MKTIDTPPPSQVDFGQEESRPGLAEYETLINSAAEKKDCIDYPNSTIAHAKIAVSKIIECCTKEICVFSRCFSGVFWNSLVVEIQDFLDKDPNRKFRVITATSPCKEAKETIQFLKDSYKGRFSLVTVKKGSLKNPNDCINFIYGDDFASRFEESDSESQRGFVSAIINFGNTSRVDGLKVLFSRLAAHA